MPTATPFPKTPLQSTYTTLLTHGRLHPNPHQQALITRLTTLQHDLLATNSPSRAPSSSPTPHGLYIHGGVGTGKSRLLDLFAATLPPEISRRRVHFHDFMRDVHARLHVARSQDSRMTKLFGEEPLERIGRQIRAEARVLCFDEFQVTDIADAMLLQRLFGAVWRGGGVVVSTSNRHPDGLYENGLNREVVLPFIRELQWRCEVWELKGEEDYRMGGGGGGEREEMFFTEREAFAALLGERLRGRDLVEGWIEVQGGRGLQLTGTVGDEDEEARTNKRFGLVHASFTQLCEQPLGTADYDALCTATDTIFLAGLRRFRADEKDAVRRFITLVDIAYERGTRVVCLSEVPLAEVFVNIVRVSDAVQQKLAAGMRVRRGGGASSSMMSTFVGDTEWSATGLREASLATGGAGETDVGFAVGRAISRIYEMGAKDYAILRQ